jgi:hypothetical protein
MNYSRPIDPVDPEEVHFLKQFTHPVGKRNESSNFENLTIVAKFLENREARLLAGLL